MDEIKVAFFRGDFTARLFGDFKHRVSILVLSKPRCQALYAPVQNVSLSNICRQGSCRCMLNASSRTPLAKLQRLLRAVHARST